MSYLLRLIVSEHAGNSAYQHGVAGKSYHAERYNVNIAPIVCYCILQRVRTVSSAGRALAPHARGHWFDPSTVHQSISIDRTLFILYKEEALPAF